MNAARIISLFADTPRGLAVAPDGARVYVAGFHSGNASTVPGELAVASNLVANAVLNRSGDQKVWERCAASCMRVVPAIKPSFGWTGGDVTISWERIRQTLEAGQACLTATLTPPGSGRRIALDRDEDGLSNGDERRSGAPRGWQLRTRTGS